MSRPHASSVAPNRLVVSTTCDSVSGEPACVLNTTARAKALGGPILAPRARDLRSKIASDVRAAMTLHGVSIRRFANAAGISKSVAEEYLKAESGCHVHLAALLAAGDRGCRRMVVHLFGRWADELRRSMSIDD